MTALSRTGTYYVWYIAKGDENHNDSTPESVKVTFSEATIKPVEGNGFVWHKGSSENSTIRFSSKTESDLANENTLTSISVDGKTLEKGTHYQTSSGSAKVTFTKSYLESLSVGTHNVVAKFSTYSTDVNATFSVAAKSSDSGSSTPEKKTDNVVTCQMAGYPANYAWNETAKACQPGYLDANGVFHSTANTKRSGVPNTYDKGLTGSLASFVTSTLFALLSVYLLRRYK